MAKGGFTANGKHYTAQSGLKQEDIDGIVEIRDYSDSILSQMSEAIARAFETIGLLAEGYAKRLCPVDTGRLRNSITHTTDGKDVYIGTNVEYAKVVELGTWKRKAKPYLRPAANDHMNEYIGILQKELKNE